MDPLAGSSWSAPSTVAGFVALPPNATLMGYAQACLRDGGTRALDIGCGAGRNAIPLAEQGWTVLGIDLSLPMIAAARSRAVSDRVLARTAFALAPMHALPIADGSADLIVAHGIWNLAASDAEFRRGVREAARAARPGAALFVFTFSRHTVGEAAVPVTGQRYIFTEFSGQPQCFLTAAQLTAEMRDAGFVPDPALALREHNLPRPGQFRSSGPPVIYEAAFRYAS